MPKLGKTNLEVPKVIMGAWALGGWFWGGSNDKTAVDTIHASLHCGINVFDTAPVYGCGHSEKGVVVEHQPLRHLLRRDDGAPALSGGEAT